MTALPELSDATRALLAPRVTTYFTTAAWGAIHLVGSERHCKTVEDAERMCLFVRGLISVISQFALVELSAGADRRSILKIAGNLNEFVLAQERDIRAVRVDGVPWEATKREATS